MLSHVMLFQPFSHTYCFHGSEAANWGSEMLSDTPTLTQLTVSGGRRSGREGAGSCWKEASTLAAVGLCILVLGASVSPSANACCKDSIDWSGGSLQEKSLTGSLIRDPWPGDPLPHPQANSSIPAADPASFLPESDEAQTTSSLDLLMACSPPSTQQKQGGWLPEAEHALFPRRLGLASVTSWSQKQTAILPSPSALLLIQRPREEAPAPYNAQPIVQPKSGWDSR